MTDVYIKRGVSQDDSLSPLLFRTILIPLSVTLREAVQCYMFHLLYMDDLELYGKSKYDLKALMNTVRLFTNNIKMKFGISKCATVVVERGRKVEDDGIQMP